MNQKVVVIYNLNGSKTIQVAEVKSMDPLKVRELVQTCKANAKQELESQENEKKAIVEDYNTKVESLNKEISDLKTVLCYLLGCESWEDTEVKEALGEIEQEEEPHE